MKCIVESRKISFWFMVFCLSGLVLFSIQYIGAGVNAADVQSIKETVLNLPDPAAEQPEWIEYRVKQGDWLSRLARKYCTSVDELKEINDLKSSTIYVGKKLKIRNIPGLALPGYRVFGRWYYPLKTADGYEKTGIASWYGSKFHGRKTSNGEIYNMHGMTAAHKTLPLGTVVLVRNMINGRTLVLRINDRGPFVGTRLIDLSKEAARQLGLLEPGKGLVEVTAI